MYIKICQPLFHSTYISMHIHMCDLAYADTRTYIIRLVWRILLNSHLPSSESEPHIGIGKLKKKFHCNHHTIYDDRRILISCAFHLESFVCRAQNNRFAGLYLVCLYLVPNLKQIAIIEFARTFTSTEYIQNFVFALR